MPNRLEFQPRSRTRRSYTSGAVKSQRTSRASAGRRPFRSTLAFVQDVPANAEIYGKVRALLPDDPPGLRAHIVIKREGGLRYVDVWDDEASWLAFSDAGPRRAGR